MTDSFYKVVDNTDTILAEDINQFADAFNGLNDVGAMTLFAPIDTPSAPTATANATAGVLNGTYTYKVAFLTGYWQGATGSGTIHISGNTSGGTASSSVSPVSKKVSLSAIPTGGDGVVARMIYRTKAGGSIYYQVVEIDDNTTTTYTDNIADASLVTVMPSTNTTGSSLSADGIVDGTTNKAYTATEKTKLASITVPTGDIVGTSDTQTLTNKSISADQIGDGSVSDTKYGYISTLTSNAQTQITTVKTTADAAATSSDLTTHEDDTTKHKQASGITQTGFFANAEGGSTTASGKYSHAEGNSTTASGWYSHAEGGSFTTAGGNYSHAEGSGTSASGVSSHAEGDTTIASGGKSHSGGVHTKAQGYAQTVIGYYNVAQGTGTSLVTTDNAFIIGNGTADASRSNALALTWEGDLEVAGDITDGNGNILSSVKATADAALPKAGGTMTGDLTISGNISQSKVNGLIKIDGLGGQTGYNLYDNGVQKWAMYIDGGNDPTILRFYNAVTEVFTLIGTGAKILGNTAWHAGNDGASSGLDADTLDGIESASFVRKDSATTMTSILTVQNNTSYTTKQARNITLSTAAASGGGNGDIWMQY
jgi:hypothetical protein